MVVLVDMITVEITNMPNAQKGDEVVLIGHQQDKGISVVSFGDE